MKKVKLYKSFNTCGVCKYWDGYRKGNVEPVSGASGWWYVDEESSAVCMHPKNSNMEKGAKRSCYYFEGR